jgi:hypothetical protein
MVHIRISTEQGGELWVNDPHNLRARMRLTKQCDRWKRMNDVTEQTRLDDQDGFWIQVER